MYRLSMILQNNSASFFRKARPIILNLINRINYDAVTESNFYTHLLMY